MRKILISILLAGAAASPVLAQDHGRWHRDQQQSDRQQAREARQQARAEPANGDGNAERMQRPAPQFQARQEVQGERRGGWERSRFEGRGDIAPQQVVQQQAPQRSYRGYRGYRGGFAGQPRQVEQVQRSDSLAGDRSGWSQDRDGAYGQRVVTQQSYRDRTRWASGGWNRDWRNDRRYDWRSYRDRHRSIFRIGIYYDPFGYGYRPFSIGYRLQPLYFGQRYWIDPAMYSLPYPPPGTQWVRYWNDALLVDMYTGEVVDVIYNFFW